MASKNLGCRVIKGIRFIVRLLLLVVAIYMSIVAAKFFYGFRHLSVEEISGTLGVLSSKPLASMGLAIGALLFGLSLLGQLLLIQYQVWRYPMSIFMGYIAGALLLRWFYLAHPFEESVLSLNNEIWYYPFIIATILLLRSMVGFKLPQRKKATQEVSISS